MKHLNKKCGLAILFKLIMNVKILIDLFKTKKDRLEEIISLAKQEIETWKNIIDIFNSRFLCSFYCKFKKSGRYYFKTGSG